MTRKEIEQIEKKIAKASQGPWRFVKTDRSGYQVLMHHGPDGSGYLHWSHMHPNDARLAMDARQDIPKLLAYIKELEECLRWYVKEDDTNEYDYNKPWLEGKRRAMKALGIEDKED